MAMRMNLALQGGGAHGAFAWGVLDRLLEEGSFFPEAISGTSAGAMNAILLAHGWQRGGADGARELLDEFWNKVSLSSPSQLLSSQLPDAQFSSMTGWMLDILRYVSPYDLNPLDVNPLRSLLSELIDFDQLRKDSPCKLFIAATAVNTGKIRLFRENELTVEHALASACLPTLHQAIDIDGECFWDGGFSGNPAVYPLIFDCDAKDIMLVLLQPMQLDSVPTSSQAINQRVTELGFQSTFMREMRAISYSIQQAKKRFFFGSSMERRFKALRFHLIESGEVLSSLEGSSKYDTRQSFLQELKLKGRDEADVWLQRNSSAIGVKSSCDVQSLFL
mgnify:CR=1 FL=1